MTLRHLLLSMFSDDSVILIHLKTKEVNLPSTSLLRVHSFVKVQVAKFGY